VKAGRIEPGSYLIVESLDRLTRQNARQALTLFLEFLNHGLNVVTLIDRRIFTPDSDHMELMMSIMLMARANNESTTKSERLQAVWKNKRANASSRILTELCPGWLEPLPDNTGFRVLEDRAAVVRQIFEMAAEPTTGAWTIMRTLNVEGVTRRRGGIRPPQKGGQEAQCSMDVG
jgi:DNA invertase Pin-like site-specific DNA recombinase